MADIINLRQARKAKARADAEKTAAANRAKFGRTKADRQVETAESKRAVRKIEGAKLEPLPADGDGRAGDDIMPIRPRSD